MFTLNGFKRRSSLDNVWMAAHLEKKLRRQHISPTDIRDSVDAITNSEMPISLRLSGQLLYGMACIHRRQLKYLLEDCANALAKLDKTNMAELPEMDSEAMLQDNTTLPENQLQANDTDFDRSYHLFMNDALAGDLLDDEIEMTEPFDNALLSMSFLPRETGLGYDEAVQAVLSALPEIDEENEIEFALRAQSNPTEQRMSNSTMNIDGSNERFSGWKGPSFSPRYGLDILPLLPDDDALLENLDDLIEIENDLLPSNAELEMAPLCEQNETNPVINLEASQRSTVESDVLDFVGSKKQKKQHKMIVDKFPDMSARVYKKMHKEMRRNPPKRSSKKSPKFKGCEEINLCSVAQVHELKAFESFWNRCLEAILQNRSLDGNNVESQIQAILQNDSDDEEWSVPRDHHDEILQRCSFDQPLLPIDEDEEAFRRLSMENAFGALDIEPFEYLPPAGGDEFPDDSAPIDWNPPSEPSQSPLPRFSQRSQYVYNRLQERLTESFAAFSINDDEQNVDCSSAKRRRSLRALEPPKEISMFDIVQGKSRLNASRWFYELLVLKGRDMIQLQQSSPYGDIKISGFLKPFAENDKHNR